MNRYFRFHTLDMQQRQATLDRLERLTELPLLLLSFAMVPLLLGPILWELSETEDIVFLSLDGFIWAVFAADLVSKLAVAPRRLAYAKEHWLDVLIVALPFFRPLRLVRLVVFGFRGVYGIRRLVNIDFLLVYGIGLVIIAATVVTAAEQGQDTIDNFADAMWWSVVTVTTVGYGDVTPTTTVGRTMAVFLMCGGIGLFGALTANLASAIVRSEDRVEANVDLLLEEVQSLRRQIGGLEETTAVVVERLDETQETRGFSLPDVANIIRGRLTRLTDLFRRGQPRSVEAEPRGEQMPDAQTFRQAWGKFATGVSVITTVHADGEVHGMTANGINSVSLDPLLVLVCAGHTTTSYPMIKETQRFAINILAEEQQPIAEYYARPTDQKTGDLAVSFSRTDRGAATVDGSLAHMACKVVTEHVAGDHTIFIAEVEEIEVGDGRPLLYFEGRFSQLAGE